MRSPELQSINWITLARKRQILLSTIAIENLKRISIFNQMNLTMNLSGPIICSLKSLPLYVLGAINKLLFGYPSHAGIVLSSGDATTKIVFMFIF